MAAKTYYLIIYDVKMPKGVSAAMPSILDEETVAVLLQDAKPVIHRKAGNRKFQVLEKRIFNYTNPDGSEVLFIICDCERVKP